MIIKFGEWTPDVPPLGNQGLATAKNVIPTEYGYGQFSSLASFSSALDAYCRGAVSMSDVDGAVHTYAGNASKIYRLVGATMTDSSKGGGYACTTESYWEFAKFGNTCIATNFDDAIQAVTLGGTTFANLDASAPQARHIAAVRDFVMVGNTYDGVDGNMPHRVRWSAFGDSTDWTVAAATQADYQDLEGNGGWVQAVVGGERAIIFQERAIWMATYVGSPAVFQFDKIEDGRGAFAPRSVVQVGGIIFFLSDNGFYAMSGGQSFPIGSGKVDRTVLEEINENYLYRVTATYVPKDKVIVWSYPTEQSVNGVPDKIVMYNWAAKKWAFAELDHELVFPAMSVGTTLDGLDSISSSIDALGISLDSRTWMGGNLQLGGFDTDHKLGYFDGTALDAVVETGEFQINQGGRAEVTEVVPLVDGGTHTVQLGERETQAGSVSWSGTSEENSSGICPVRSNSRYHSIRVNITGNFTNVHGADIRAVAVGKR